MTISSSAKQTRYITLKSFYSIPSDNRCIKGTDLGLNAVPAAKNCLLGIPAKRRFTLPTYELLQALKKAGIQNVTAKTGTIRFQRVVQTDLPRLEIALKRAYQKHYPGILIKKVAFLNLSSFDGIDYRPDRCKLRLPKASLEKSEGVALVICGKKRAFVRYHIDAVIPVYKAKHQIKRDRILSPEDLITVTIPFERFYDKPVPVNGALGLMTRQIVPVGHILTQKAVRPIPAVRRHQKVHSFLKEGAVTVEFEAMALQNGDKGDLITIRRSDGRTLGAVVIGPATVEVR